jgi:hypothetical protein
MAHISLVGGWADANYLRRYLGHIDINTDYDQPVSVDIELYIEGLLLVYLNYTTTCLSENESSSDVTF